MFNRSLPIGLLVTTATVAAAIFFLLPSLTHSTSQATSLGGATVSLLAQPRSTADGLPSSVLATPLATHLDANRSRLAATVGDDAVYVAPGAESDRICLVVYERSTDGFSASCAARTLLTTGSVYLSWPRRDGTERVIGLVGDGHALAQSNSTKARVANNVFELDNAKDAAITLIGTDGQHQNLDLGPQFPPNVAP
jgi:hypothetical protein